MYRGKRASFIQMIVIAAAYVALTLVANAFGMAKDIVQVRISDALMILPVFTGAAIPGLTIGCLISNTIISLTPGEYAGQMLLTKAATYYVILGSLSTFISSVISFLIRKKKFLVCIPPIILNTITMPLIYHFIYRFEDPMLKCFLTVGVGEIISCGLLGTALLLALEDSKDKLFPKGDIVVKANIDEDIKASDMLKSSGMDILTKDDFANEIEKESADTAADGESVAGQA